MESKKRKGGPKLDERRERGYTVGMKVNDVVFRYAEEIDSTNRWAMAEGDAAAPHGSLFVARRQTAGRGRLERSWQSEGLGLYMTLLLRPEMALRDVPRVTMLAAVAICGAARFLGLPAAIKWPNDVVVGGKKLCGILCESRARGMDAAFCVLGTGVNMTQRAEDFPPEFRGHATSVWMETGKRYETGEFIGPYLQEIERWYDGCVAGSDGFYAAYRGMLVTLGREVRVRDSGGEWEGIAADVREDGSLVVISGGETRAVYAGDVSVRGKDGYV